MKVILLEDIKNLGKKFEIKKVKDGFGRNFLFPKGMAILANKKNISKIDKLKEQEKSIINKLLKEAEEIKKITLEFVLKKGEKGEIYGSVNSRSIKEKLEEKGFNCQSVNLVNNLKEEGEHQVEINLGKGVKVNLKVVIHLQD